MRLGILAASFLLGLCLLGTRAVSQDNERIHFERRVRPLLLKHCIPCHGPKKQESNLRLDSRAHLLAGGSLSGPAVLLRRPDASPLLLAVGHQEDLKMPPNQRLPDAAIRALQQWVRAGVPWSVSDTAEAATSPAEAWVTHWAAQPLKSPPLPPINPAEMVRSPIDAFVLRRLDSQNLAPSQPASPHTLIRRAHYVLTGLPPTPSDIVRFTHIFQRDPDAAMQRLVDQLLASPRYGERWARHWLDLARYADTKGYVRLQEQKNYYYAYTYRDYVIESWNADLPFDQFVREQLAGDQPGILDKHQRTLAALGFLTLGRRFTGNQHDIIDDRIDVVTRSFLALTVGCARCHDHKFDPIPTADYYALYGVFSNTVEPSDLPYLSAAQNPIAYLGNRDTYRAKRAALDKQIQQYLPPTLDMLRADTPRYLRAVLTGRKTFLVPLPAATGELRQTFVERWVEYLEGTQRHFDPVFAAWHTLRKLSAHAFPTRAASELTALADTSPRPLNGLIVNYLNATPLESMEDVADRYGSALLKIHDEILTAQKQDNAFQKFTDPDKEQLRLVLYGPGSPFAVSPREALDAYLLDAEWNRTLSQAYLDYDAWLAGTGQAAPRAHVLYDSPRVHEPHIFVRGNPERVGPRISRAAPSLLGRELATPFRHGSGRRELADAIVHPHNPLTARVLVNRIWAHHFGRGLVPTLSNFGLRAPPPSHPQLLDYLAYDLLTHGWSIKRLHRMIMLSRSWQQTSVDRPLARQVDPENRFLWRYRRRRVEFEILRDSILSVTGQLDLRMLGPPVPLFGSDNGRRTLYGHIDRSGLPTILRLFDFPSPDTHSPSRSQTTAPQQALYLMNNEFVRARAVDLATLALDGARSSGDESVDSVANALYQIVLGRSPTTEELDRCRQFVKSGQMGWSEIAQMLLVCNEFLFVD